MLETPNFELWPLAGVMAGVTPQAVIEVAERITEAPLPLTERSELAGLLILLAGLRVPRQALADVLRRSHIIKDIWKESSFAEAVHEILIKDARAEGKAESIFTILEARFGSLEADVRRSGARMRARSTSCWCMRRSIRCQRFARDWAWAAPNGVCRGQTSD